MPNRMNHKPNKSILSFVLAFCCAALSFGRVISASADEAADETLLEQQRAMPVQTNEIVNWPVGPVVSADSAILMEVDTGTILYAKNIHKKEYPASTTKILTTLIAAEACSLDETVTFSHDAVFDNPPGSSGIAMDVGQTLTMEQCLNAILIRSANEVAFAVAEHITGTSDWSVFADMMNRRAEEMGCLNSHFVNPNGLPDDDHYTTAYDLAMIGRGFFANEMLCKITLTRRLEIPASDTIPETKLENNNMQIIPGGTYAYPYLVGCKTGYTNAARSCLVSCAEKDGMKLICVVMRDEAPLQYEDTISLFDYGFNNFDKTNVSQSETKYNIGSADMFYGGTDIIGSSHPLLTLNRDDCIILPRTASFDDIDSTVSYESAPQDWVAVIRYTYHGADIGSVRVSFDDNNKSSTPFASPEPDAQTSENRIVYIDIFKIIGAAAVAAVLLLLFFLLRAVFGTFVFPGKSARYLRGRGSKKHSRGSRTGKRNRRA